ncbi:TPA: flavodoxin family protein [Candidatus Poribacteria bacterium]|nr:flavodoxin family protein [Candidatus Poribacteria bacterium]
MCKIIGIAGSPRRDGNSTTLLRQVLQGAEESGAEAQIIYLNDLTFRGCQACDGCVDTGECTLKDELTPYYPKLRAADIWILASPVYFDGVSGQTKLFFDRCRCFAMEVGNLKGKRRAAIILTYEDRPRDDYREIAQRLANYFSWFGDFDTVELFVESRLGPADAASRRPELLEKSQSLGHRLVMELKGG